MASLVKFIFFPVVGGVLLACGIQSVGSILYSYKKLTDGDCGISQKLDHMGFYGELFCK